MSEHAGYIVKVNKIRQHTNADKLQIATFFGNDTCVDLSVKEGDIGIYFPTDLQLSVEYCEANCLLRKKDANGNNIGGYMDPEKRNVKAIKLRGEKSDGIYMPLNSLSAFGDISTLKVGDVVEIFNGHQICQKYIPKRNKQKYYSNGNRTRKKSAPTAPLFAEHADTEQLAYHVDDFHAGDHVEITLKMHGTSQRTAYLPVLKKVKRSLFDIIFKREGTPIYDWGYVSGTRRTVLNDWEGGFYGSDEFRKIHADFFEGKLHKGESVYYEVVGFTTNGTPIMSDADNRRTNDKEFIKKYGNTTRFSYGCHPDGQKTLWGMDEHGQFSLDVPVPQSDFYVYRMTMTNEDGDVVEYSPDFMRYRCDQMGCKTVPRFIDFKIPSDTNVSAGDLVKEICEQFYDGPDPIGLSHIREGVVARIVNRPYFTAYKHKNFYFKCIEGIIKDAAAAPDMEEAQEL